MRKISYLGPQGTYSEKAAGLALMQLGSELELRPEANIERIAHQVAHGESHYGLIPYYNLLTGLVQEGLQHIYQYGLTIVGSQRLPIVHSIGKVAGQSLSGKGKETQEIYSHPKALAQCSQYLASNFPNAAQVAVDSTVTGIKRAQESGGGMVIACADSIRQAGLQVIGEDIGNSIAAEKNYTDFYIVARDDSGYQGAGMADNLTMIAVSPCADRQGLLAEFLVTMNSFNLDNAKIHSAPALDCCCSSMVTPQMFFIEVKSHKDDKNFKHCMHTINQRFRADCRSNDGGRLSVLGCYETPCGQPYLSRAA